MRISKNFVQCMVLAALMMMIVPSLGCRDRGVYHDPYYHDDHPAASEQPYYNRWEQETHRTHVDLSKRSQDEQKQYWDWRHQQH